MNKEDKELYTEAMKRFGKPSQIEMLIEELAELTLALQKFKRNPTQEKVREVCDEMADVEIMLDQNKLIFSEKEIQDRKMFKLNRLRVTLSDTMYLKYQMDEQSLEESLKEKPEVE